MCWPRATGSPSSGHRNARITLPTRPWCPPDAPEGLRGRATYKAYVELHRSTFPDLRITLTDVLAEGDRVAVQWTAQGTHHVAYGSVVPTGAGVIVRGMDLVHIAGGRI